MVVTSYERRIMPRKSSEDVPPFGKYVLGLVRKYGLKNEGVERQTAKVVSASTFSRMRRGNVPGRDALIAFASLLPPEEWGPFFEAANEDLPPAFKTGLAKEEADLKAEVSRRHSVPVDMAAIFAMRTLLEK